MPLFNWIRRCVRNAVLSGVNDAVEVLAVEGTPDDPEPALRLKLVATPALPDGEASDEAPARKKAR